MRNYLQTLALFNRNVRLYLVTAFVIGFSYYGFFLVLFNLYLLRLGYGPRFIGTINAAGPLAFIMFSFPAGAMGRRWGSRQIIIAGLFLYLLGFGLMPLAEFVPASWQVSWLFATYIIAFMGGPLYWVNSSVFMMSATTMTERNHVFSVRTALLPLAGFCGSLLSGLLIAQMAGLLQVGLDDPAPYRYGLWLGAAFYVVALVAMFLTDKAADGEQTRAVINWRALPLALIIPIMLVEMLRMAGEMGTHVLFNVYLDDGLGVTAVQIGVILAIASLLAGIATLTMPLLAKRWSLSQTILWSMIGMVVLLVSLAIFPNVIVAGVGFVGVLALANISRSALLVYRMEIVLPLWWAAMSAAGVTAQGAGESAILFAGGHLIATAGYTAFFLMTAVVVCLGVLFFAFFFQRPGQQLAVDTMSVAE